MENLTIQDKLYNKLSKEYNQFLDGLKEKTPDEIIDKSYEKVFKEELKLLFEEGNIDNETAKILLKLDYPLDELYREWLGSDDSFLDMLRDCTDNLVNKLSESEVHNKPKQTDTKRKQTLDDKLRAAKEKVKEQNTQNNKNLESRNKREEME